MNEKIAIISYKNLYLLKLKRNLLFDDSNMRTMLLIKQ